MEQKSVSRLEIINDLEDIIEEIRSGEYSSVALMQNITVDERKISNNITESHQTGKQILIVMTDRKL